MFSPWHRFLLLTAFFALAAAGPAIGQTGDLSRKELDTRLHKLLLDTMNLGADTYNSGNREGCYQLYLGTLRTMAVMLDHRPDLQKVINEKIKKAKSQLGPGERAFTLREALDECYSVIAKDLGLVAAKKSLWDRLGGEAAVRAVVKDVLAAGAADPKVDFTRGGKYKITPEGLKDLEQKLVELVSAVSGGPLTYTGRIMKEVHKGMGITDAQFDALAGHVAAALKKHNVAEADQKAVLAAIALTRGDIVEKKGDDKDKKEPKKSLYERLGGEKAITAVVDDVVKRSAANPKVNFLRKGTPAEVKLDDDAIKALKKNLVDLIGQATGGPQKYKGRDLKEVHKAMMITNAEFDAMAGDLKATLDHFKVPAAEQEELLAIVASTRPLIVEEKKK
jgi:hemoglobin